MSTRFRSLLRFAPLVLALAVVRTTADAASPPLASPPVLIDQTGRHFTFDQLRGTPYALTFVASRCTDACPLINAQYALIQKRIIAKKVHARLLTITIDPAFDTPFVMSKLARQFGADPRVWQVASGSRKDIDTVMKFFGVDAEPDEHGVPDSHTTFIYIIDASGKRTSIFLAGSNMPDDVSRALNF
jgi:protein SCO1